MTEKEENTSIFRAGGVHSTKSRDDESYLGHTHLSFHVRSRGENNCHLGSVLFSSNFVTKKQFIFLKLVLRTD